MSAGPEAPEPKPQKPGRGTDWQQVLREAAPLLGIGTSSALTVLLGLGAGYALDERLGTRPLLFLAGSVLGILAAVWQVYKLGMSRKP